MNASATILAPFSWSGTMNRRDYLHHTAIATVIFAVGFYLHVRFEDVFSSAFAIPKDATMHPLLFTPFAVELLTCIGSPLTLPTMLFLLLITLAGGGIPAEEAAAMAAAHPSLFMGIFVLSTLLMLLGSLRSLALASRRLRAAGSGIWKLFALFSVLILLYAFVLHDGLPFASCLYVLALLLCFITQCCMLMRPGKHLASES